jgi:hypothetical protein
LRQAAFATDAVEKVVARCCHTTGRKIDLSDRPTSRSEGYVKGKATLENLAHSSTLTFSTTSTGCCQSVIDTGAVTGIPVARAGFFFLSRMQSPDR